MRREGGGSTGGGAVEVNGEPFNNRPYEEYHRKRLDATLAKLRELEALKIVEIGGHPWAMTSRIIDDPDLELCATISAEEVTRWPDDIGVYARPYKIRTPGGREASFMNYSANVERTLFDIREEADTVLACEIVEHLTRAPHVLFLNANHWLPVGGKLIVTTPNGVQFRNPLRRKPYSPAFRCHTYERHSYLFSRALLVDLIELCGFRVLEMAFLNVHDRSGPSRVYDWLRRIPTPYFREMFSRTIYVAAEKTHRIDELKRVPLSYTDSGQWEYIANGSSGP